MVGTRSLAALCGGNTIRAPGAPPKAQECKVVFWYAAGRSGTGGIFATRPPVPSRHLDLNTPNGLRGQSGER